MVVAVEPRQVVIAAITAIKASVLHGVKAVQNQVIQRNPDAVVQNAMISLVVQKNPVVKKEEHGKSIRKSSQRVKAKRLLM